MIIKSNRELSFRAKLDAGWTKEQLMKHYCLNEDQYQKVINQLEKIKLKSDHQ